MNKINIEKKYSHQAFKISSQVIKKKAGEILKNLQLENIELNIYLCSDKFIKPLNNKFRNIDEPTDILSFSYNEINPETGLTLLGELIISIDSIIKNAKEYKTEIETEFFRMVVHGILHLIGMTHNNNADKRKMTKKTEYLLALILQHY